MIHALEIFDQQFQMHPSGVLFWENEGLLLVSDVHLGKVSHFRKYGAAVPLNAIGGNFEMLDRCVAHFSPKKTCFLGDLFHSHLNAEWQLFESWVQRSRNPLMLITGNHDIISPFKYESLGIEVLPELRIGRFLLTHHPQRREGCFTVSGHIHPAIQLRGKGRQSLRLPCFFKSGDQLILPAFGAFTGMHTLEKEEGNEVYAIAEQQVIKI